MVSGFVIAHAYGQKMKTRPGFRVIFEYYYLRLARIYPLHLFIVMILSFFFAVGLWYSDLFEVSDILLSVTLSNVIYNKSINIPSWSVSAEWVVYLCFPFMWSTFFRVNNRALLSGFIMILAMGYAILVYLNGWSMHWHYGWVVIWRVFTGFIIGCFLYKAYLLRFQNDRSGNAETGFILSFGAFIGFGFMGMPFPFLYFLMPVFIYYLVQPSKPAIWLFSGKAIRYLGTISYAIYMVHYPVLEVFRIGLDSYYAALDPVQDQALIRLHLALIIVAVLCVAALAYHTIEYPCRSWAKKRLLRLAHYEGAG
ncbi:MAG: acyltransferase [Alphaproteobacteria bacterium]|nr:acyltransferase [Alphaproteobacteria bacterium]